MQYKLSLTSSSDIIADYLASNDIEYELIIDDNTSSISFISTNIIIKLYEICGPSVICITRSSDDIIGNELHQKLIIEENKPPIKVIERLLLNLPNNKIHTPNFDIEYKSDDEDLYI